MAFESMPVNLLDFSAGESRSLEGSSGSSSVFKDLEFLLEPDGLEFLPEPDGLVEPGLVEVEGLELVGGEGLVLAGLLCAFSGNCQHFSFAWLV